jgi:hypothetical protein
MRWTEFIRRLSLRCRRERPITPMFNATYKSDAILLSTGQDFVPVGPTVQEGRVRVATFYWLYSGSTVTVAAGTVLANRHTVALCQLPANSIVVGGVCNYVKGSASTLAFVHLQQASAKNDGIAWEGSVRLVQLQGGILVPATTIITKTEDSILDIGTYLCELSGAPVATTYGVLIQPYTTAKPWAFHHQYANRRPCTIVGVLSTGDLGSGTSLQGHVLYVVD